MAKAIFMGAVVDNSSLTYWQQKVSKMITQESK